MMKIGIVSQFNPHADKKAHSGILYKINEAVEKAGFETVWIRNPRPFLFVFIARIITFLARIGIKTNIYFDRTIWGAKLLASTVDKNAVEQVDYLLVIHYYHIPAFFKTNKPIIYHSDATFELANNYYLHDMPRWNANQAERIELLALQNSSYHLSPSVWRQNSVINHYGIKKNKCFVLEYGPCVAFGSINRKKKSDNILRLLFVGVAWERKGGDIAVESCRLLNEFGVKSLLTIIGLKEEPEICKGKNYIDFKGYLNKNNTEQNEVLKQYYEESDIFILPTLAECAGVVFSESSLSGLPIITYDTGGVGSYVINGENGYRLPVGSTAEAFAKKIKDVVVNAELVNLSAGARRYANEHLNWDNWTKWFKNEL